ncbi:MAG TPA: FG-GAP-like repeat-containing protein, partial [Pyrinomonadaceae bacterium]|nr:FG-GAP-like repeat-containing protein [Pyrinomonadaceae bacterium]
MSLTNSSRKLAAAATLALTLAAAAALFAPRPASAQAAACNFPGFTTPTAHAARPPSRAVVVAGDFNHDGAADIATANDATRDVSVLLSAPGGGFAPAAHFPTGFQPTGIATADFNGDGHLDLVTSNGENDNGDLTILFGDGAGRFERTKPIFITPEGLRAFTLSATVADFNVDGNMDVAVVSNSNVSVVLGDGAGNFTPRTFALNNSPSEAWAVAADFNGDGIPDLAAALDDAASIVVMLSDGAGGLGDPTFFAAGTHPRTLAVADFNKDGRADLATANSRTGTVSVLLGDGAGGFAAAKSFSAGSQFPSAVGVADFDADGNADLAVGSVQPSGLLLLEGDGAGNFAPSVHVELPLAGPSSIAVANLDFDARPDVAVGDAFQGRVVTLHTTCSVEPSTTFRPSADSLGEREGRPATVRVIREGSVKAAGSVSFSLSGGSARAGTDFRPVSGTLSFAPGETFKQFQFETLQDTLVEGVETINVHLSDAAGGAIGTPNPSVFNLSDDEPRPVLTVANVTVTEGDSGTRDATFTLSLDRPTLATLTVEYATADGAATAGSDYVAASGAVVFSPGQTTKTIRVAVRGDDLLEINEPFLLTLTNRSPGSVTTPPRATAVILDDDLSCPAPAFGQAASFAVGGEPHGLAAADFNGDGRIDLATSSHAGVTSEIVILSNDGAGGFSVTGRVGVSSGPNDLVAADFNGDGKVDLAASMQGADAVALLRGSGTGSFAAPVNFPVGDFPVDLLTADFNRDGRPDIATANIVSKDITVRLNNGLGGFSRMRTERISSTAAPVPGSLAAADFNGDGRLDLVVGSGSPVNGDLNSGVAVLFGNGAGDFTEHDFTLMPGFAEVAVGDFNRDEKADVVVVQRAFGRVSVLLGTGTGDFAAPVSFAAQFGPADPAVADFNGDFNPDIVLVAFNRATGASGVLVFYGNGAGAFSEGTHFPFGQGLGRPVAADLNGDGRPDIATPKFTGGTVSVLL